MEELETGYVELELKYCERCGALWLRIKGSDVVFCGPCAKTMAVLAPKLVRPQRPGGVIVIDSRDEIAFWMEGGNA